MLKTIGIATRSRTELLEITSQVQSVLSESGADSGVCLVYVPHTTAAVTINENADPSVGRDLNRVFSDLVPARASYEHNEGNSDAHVKAALVGPSVMIPFEGGRLALGTWQGIYFCEFDGPRQRMLSVKLVPDRPDRQ